MNTGNSVHNKLSALYRPQQNYLLSSLPPANYRRILPHLELVSLPQKHTLYKLDHNLCHAYFPITSIVAITSFLNDGTSVECALVGNEGMIGMCLFMDRETSSPNQAIVLNAGYAYRMKGQVFIREFHHCFELQKAVLCHAQALISQISQTAACNRHHIVDEQLCRLLLLIQDRSSSNKIAMTQELISSTLGVRREGVTEAAGRLQKAGLIRYKRGHITILDRPKLEKRSCECYFISKE